MYFPLTSHQSNYRGSHHVMHNHPDSSALSNDGSVDEEIPAKRPCLTVDVSRRAVDPPNSADSAASGTPMLNHVGVSPPAESKVRSGIVCKAFDEPVDLIRRAWCTAVQSELLQ